MKLTAPYQCDYCGVLKGESNHWWLRFRQADDSKRLATLNFTLLRWNDKKAGRADFEHICSEACAVKALSKWMAQPQ
jgi:hypothetical protein